MKKNCEGGHLLVLSTRPLPQLVSEPLLGPWAWRSPLSPGEKTWKGNQAMGSLGVVWERREAGQRARCNERPKVCASLPSKSDHRQGSNKQKCGYHLRFSNLSKSDFSPIKNRPPIIYVWNFVCQGQIRATSFIAFAVFFSMSKWVTVGRCRREWGLREGVNCSWDLVKERKLQISAGHKKCLSLTSFT